MKELPMRSIKLSDTDCIFVHYALRHYANHTEGLESEDKEEIYEVARKFIVV
jgi:hypothetical protein